MEKYPKKIGYLLREVLGGKEIKARDSRD